MKLADLTTYLDEYLKISAYEDRSNNGLQVQGNLEVTRAAFAVDACLASFNAAVSAGAQVLIVHHGLFWSQHIQVTGMHYERLKTLILNNISLYAAHIPLDAHPEVGNNIQLARLAGLQHIEPWGQHRGDTIGFVGELAEPLSPEQLSARLERHIGPGNRVQATGHPARRVAVLSGFGVDFTAEARAAGADTLITGETSHTWVHPVSEQGLNVIYGGHYNTETVGVKALAAHLAEHFGLDTVFIDLPTGL
ncbi:MAG: Nif3-like dinuclear metal center hexameric protein [Chloroflexi bacterium]|nr:Nif3-like dinuclear metal center hexameric protein [Chloroflexota bacterium]MCL5274811.1 Nif3-like dinuclear metal center hexameric protein [Chloroflexota bacterium]